MTLIDIDDLKLRRRDEEARGIVPVPGGVISIGTSGGDNYWAYRVDLTENQAVIGFPKHGTIGIDFLHNHTQDLPYTAGVEYLADFFADGRLLGGDAEIPRAHVLRAIEMIREAVAASPEHDKHCSGECQTIRNEIYWHKRSASDDPTADLEPHWVEDCPLGPVRPDPWNVVNGRDEDGWPIPERDEEGD